MPGHRFSLFCMLLVQNIRFSSRLEVQWDFRFSWKRMWRLLSFVWHRAVWYKLADVSEDCATVMTEFSFCLRRWPRCRKTILVYSVNRKNTVWKIHRANDAVVYIYNRTTTVAVVSSPQAVVNLCTPTGIISCVLPPCSKTLTLPFQIHDIWPCHLALQHLHLKQLC
jgi:hypothetical protein